MVRSGDSSLAGLQGTWTQREEIERQESWRLSLTRENTETVAFGSLKINDLVHWMDGGIIMKGVSRGA